jgi:type II secretory pathway pseudopilin PulG
MKNNKGITLIILLCTVIVLLIITGLVLYNGMETYKRSIVVKFETYMKVIQKKVDLMIEENYDIATLGSELTQSQRNTLQEIINNDTSNYIQTDDVNNSKIRYFSSSDINSIFDIPDVNDDIAVNFSNREVISLNGVEKDGVMHYVEYGLH